MAIRILVPGPHIDKPIVRAAGRAAYEELLEADVEIYEYQPTMLHAKTLVVDGAWASVGSVNFDNRSFQLHDEATLCAVRRARGPAHRVLRDRPAGQRMAPGRWDDRPLWQRAQERVLTLVRREL